MAKAKQCSKGKSAEKNGVMKKTGVMVVSLWRGLTKVGREDPRRVIHALKVGFALTLVSFLYVLEPLFQGVGQNAMWAVMTVVVVFEFTAGATICKGLNRGFGTLCAGSLAFFIEFIAEKTGTVFRGVFVGTSVFTIGCLLTYLRFIPKIKKNYEYGLVIFLLTFNLLTVSSFRVQNILHIARERLYTIAIGCLICLCMSLFVFPNWSGEDLHHSTVYKFEGLARSIEVCVNNYFQDKDIEVTEEEEEEESSKASPDEGYRRVLDSKSSDEALALFASWEPRHSTHCHRYPWQQYVKLGSVLRHFGYTAVALHGCLESEIQTPRSIRSLFRDPCVRVANEVSKVLVELAHSIRNRRHCSPDVLSDHLNEALQDLNSAIKSKPRLFIGSNNAQKILAERKREKDGSVEGVLPSDKMDKTNVSMLKESRSKRLADGVLPSPTSNASTPKEGGRPPLNKLAITGLDGVLPSPTSNASTPKEGGRPPLTKFAITGLDGVLPSPRSNASTPKEGRSKKASDQLREINERKTLRPTLSKIAMTGLEFSETLPFAAFASLLVEMVARLELVIMEVNELATAAHFKEFTGNDEISIRVNSDVRNSGRELQSHMSEAMA